MQKFITLVNGTQKLVDAGVDISTGATDAGKPVVLKSDGTIHESMMPTGIGADIKILIASEAIGAGKFVNIYDNATVATVRLADATTAGKQAHGFVLSAVTQGGNATVYFEGNDNAITGATAGNVYLSTTPGGFTSTPPSTTGNIVQKVGVATSATSINVEFAEPIELA
jgi:hypothetical protein